MNKESDNFESVWPSKEYNLSRLSSLIFGAVLVQTGGNPETPETPDTDFGIVLA